jgi:hypothetical protein
MTDVNLPAKALNGNPEFDVRALRRIAYQGQPVLTTDMLAKVYGTEANNIKVNASQNTGRFQEGAHYFKLNGAELRAFKDSVTAGNSVQIDKRARALILWTARGAARHAKMLDTEQAWEMFEKLEDAYFTGIERVGTKEAAAFYLENKLRTFREARLSRTMTTMELRGLWIDLNLPMTAKLKAGSVPQPDLFRSGSLQGNA